MATMVKAGVVTPEQALQQAQKFIQTREDAGSRTSKTPGPPAQLSIATQVSGLYVFNVANDGGFVIVSNDDRTVPILGFSDSGSIDPDDMPDNMCAWLQGYADEIVWLNEHSIIVNVPESANAPRHADRHSTTAIAPLVQTKWNQRAPYNNLCPLYDGTNRAVTGCVATAMAQVMYYTETKAGNNTTQTTKEIPAYTTRRHSLSMDAIPAGATINWSSMLLNYKSGYTTDKADAVAELMRCCGCSVQMDYASSSNAYASDVPNALKEYFDYNTTTQIIIRSLYSSTQWANLIYHELEHARPVLYAGQSSGGGHAFVCDGYKYEGDTDYFHINWGWGGTSDDYFVLSTLNPYEQGAGGSSTNDGFHFGQQAVIGIQKTGDTGTVGNVTPITLNLTASTTLSSNAIVLGNTVDVTLNITNNGSEAYEGDIHLGYIFKGNGYLVSGDAYNIPVGGTQSCEYSFTPSMAGTYQLLFYYPNKYGSYSPDYSSSATLTVLAAANIPFELSVAPRVTTAEVSWDGIADSYTLEYAEAPNGIGSSWYYYGDKTIKSGWRSGKLAFSCGVMFPAGSYAGKNVTKVSVFDRAERTGSIAIYNDGDNAPGGDPIFEQSISFTGSYKFLEYSSNDVAIDNNKNVWVIVNFEGTTQDKNYPAATSSNTSGDANGRWFNDGNWHDLADYGAADQAFMIRAEFGGDDPSTLTWTTVENAVSPCTLENLTPSTSYAARVKGHTDAGESEWLTTSFFTLTPIELANDATDNSTVISTNKSKRCEVTLTDRTLFKDGKWNTICLPFDVVIEDSPLKGATAKTLTSASTSESVPYGTHIDLTFGDAVDKIEAGKPYIIRWEPAAENIVNPVFVDVLIKDIPESDRTISMAGGNVQFIGYYDAFGIDDTNDNLFYMNSDGKLAHTGTGRTLLACRAYFLFSEYTSNGKLLVNFGDEETTAITTTNVTNDTNGGNAWYSLDGRKLLQQPARKGVYIHDGVKVVIK